MNKEYPIIEAWEEYYNYLEELRQSGVTNMFGAVPYLKEEFKLNDASARNILANWMHNYFELKEKYGW